MKTSFKVLLLAVTMALDASHPSSAAATNQIREWNSYRTIMWIGDSAYRQPQKLPLFFQRLREMGINTAMVYGDGDPRPLQENQFPYYVENMVNRGLCLKFNSTVKDWDAFVTKWAKNGRPESAFRRDYCLDDPQWRRDARDQMQRLVRKNLAQEPLAYDIRDELSTTISANPFDYDFNPIALDAFRRWLKSQYRNLEALNEEWETQFGTWNDVRPFSTDQIKARMASGEASPRGKPDWRALASLKFDPASARASRTRWNFAPWADFRTYMDLSLARALDDIRSAAHELDPRTPVGIEGTQMPSAFGGYDLWQLSRVLDWVEPYDIGNAREIFGSFMPDKPILTTVGERDTHHARRRLWHLLLEGDRGCLVWWSEDCINWQHPEYELTAKARQLTPVLQEMTSPLAQILLRARREYDPIYLLYSQPSIQVDWLLESTVDGSTWPRRFSSFEASHNRMVRVRNSWLKLFQDLGYSPRFISGKELADLGRNESAPGILVLPQCLALSETELESVARYRTANAGFRTVMADGTPGLFDEHGRLRATNRLEEIFPPTLSARASFVSRATKSASGQPVVRTESKAGDIAQYGVARLKAEPRSDWPDWARQHCSLPRDVSLAGNPRVRIHRFQVRDVRLLAFECNVSYQMSEDLKQAGGNESLEVPVELEATLAKQAYVFDLNTQSFLAHTNRVRFKLDPWRPTILALSPERVSASELLQRLAAAP